MKDPADVDTDPGPSVGRVVHQGPKDLGIEPGAGCDAVQGIAGKGISILTGGPGCGKTTATRVLVSLLEAMKRRVTAGSAHGAGRPAHGRGGRAGKPEPFTDFWDGQSGRFKKNDESPLETDFLVVDECSMLDISLTALATPCRAGHLPGGVHRGDYDQLPSVGAGNVLKDLIQSGICCLFPAHTDFPAGGPVPDHPICPSDQQPGTCPGIASPIQGPVRVEAKKRTACFWIQTRPRPNSCSSSNGSKN